MLRLSEPLVPVIVRAWEPGLACEVVLTVSVAAAPGATEFGAKLALMPGRRPLTLSPTGPLKPPVAVTVTVYVVLRPRTTTRLTGEADREKSGRVLTVM